MTFRFDALEHEYTDAATGEVFPHITKMLMRTGWVDDLWMTDEAKIRGTAVHKLTADYDLGAIEDVVSLVTPYKGYLLAHISVVNIEQLAFLAIEEPYVHTTYRYGGRLDRVAMVRGARSIWEIKSGPPEKSHQVQTALQAMLDAEECGIPCEHLKRYVEYLKPNGKFKVLEHANRQDFVEARRVISRCCGR